MDQTMPWKKVRENNLQELPSDEIVKKGVKTNSPHCQLKHPKSLYLVPQTLHDGH